MKTRIEIIREIIFHEAASAELEQMGKMSAVVKAVHDGRAIALRWVIGERATPIAELKKEIK